jgi:hypothetical protein
MTLSVVLRLIPGELLEGRIAGEAEVVETGERRIVRDLDELLRFLVSPLNDVQTHRRRGEGAPAGKGG